jgi:hypothetical protein
MSSVQRVVPELSADLQAFATLDCESPFNRLYDMTEMPTQLGTPTGGSYPSPHTDVMTRASRVSTLVPKVFYE